MLERPPLNAVLFDMDGTLLNSWDALLGAYHDATTQVLGAPSPVEPADVYVVIQLRGREAFSALGGGDPEVAKRLEAAFGESYRSRSEQIRLYDGVAAMLMELRGLGLRLGIATSKSRVRLDRDLRQTGIVDLLDASLCGDEVVFAKPDPTPIRTIMEMLSVEPDRALYVGDGANDVMAAHAAGVRAVGAGYGFHPEACRAAGPDLWIEQPGDLPGLITSSPHAA